MQRNRSKQNIKHVVQKPTAPSEYTLQKNVEFNGKIYSYIQNLNLLTESEQEELKECGWFQVGLPREVSLEILLQLQPGSFLVRQSETVKNSFALSMRVPSINGLPKLTHYLIEKSSNGYRFKGFSREFASIKCLVVHHSIIKGHLPVPLLLSRAQDLVIHNLIVEESPEIEQEIEEKSASCFCKK